LSSPSPTPSPFDDSSQQRPEELQKLPGIGPKLAERITAQRPYKTIEDLDNVPSIGKATIDRLRPLIDIGSTPRAAPE
jgi:competence protein ComEA